MFRAGSALVMLTVASSGLAAQVTPSQDLVGRQVITTRPAEFHVGKETVATSEEDLELFTVEKVNDPWLKVAGRKGWIYSKHVVLVGEGKSVILVPTRCGNYNQETKEWLNGNWPMNEALLVDSPVAGQDKKTRTCLGLALCEFAAHEFELVDGQPVNGKILAESNRPRRVWISCPAIDNRRAPASVEECRIANYEDGPLLPKTTSYNQRFVPVSSQPE